MDATPENSGSSSALPRMRGGSDVLAANRDATSTPDIVRHFVFIVA